MAGIHHKRSERCGYKSCSPCHNVYCQILHGTGVDEDTHGGGMENTVAFGMKQHTKAGA